MVSKTILNNNLKHMRKLLFFLLGVLIFSAPLLAQDRTISGRVTDDKGAGIANASVIIKNTQLGTTTSADGKFSLNAPASAKVLVISSVGLKTQEVTIGSQNNIAIVLQD